ncbi:glycoside hydrolase family 3 protein [Nocardioides panacis]|uniref:Glycoside hydrolase family 3 protein n=1 Tax=Nocardioides panacis TaxID=2849501 RepID=A0A975XYZ8_9ACTN|nr:glycoside hydrolase family 3 protein [Nocardioides panacis]QWZ06905.1 glycoside hydrolase family 3 protein [Nocardioides panacis]
MLLPRTGAAVATAALLAVSACGAAGPDGPDPRPTSSGGSWKQGGSSGTGTFRPLPVETGWGPSPGEIDRARSLVGGLSLRERAGQVIVASYGGTAAPTGLVRRLHLGGVVAFSENLAGAGQVARSNRALQRSAARDGRRWPVLVGVDQEGGRVARVTSGVTGFPAFMTAGAAGDPGLTREAYAASGAELLGLGFTVDFAPDSDVTVGPADPAIGARSAGSSPERVAAQVTAAVQGFASSGLVPVVKHFPGHGSVTTDSHYGLPVQHRSLAELRARDLVPFRAAVDAGTSAVMVGHLDVRAVDPRTPSSLSHAVVAGLLRDELGFRGVAFTDSLQMAAVADRFGSAGSAVRALRAGEDVLLMPPDPRAARDGIVAAVRDGRLPQARLDQAAIRMVALLLHQRDQAHRPRPAGSGGDVSRRLSAAGITSVSGPCSGRLVGPRVRVSGPASAVARFRAAAASAGLRVVGPARRTGKHAKRPPRATTVRLVDSTGGPARGDVVVALDIPYVLGGSTAPVRIATYGETPGAFDALLAVLLGRATAPGRLPVDVAGVPRDGC